MTTSRRDLFRAGLFGTRSEERVDAPPPAPPTRRPMPGNPQAVAVDQTPHPGLTQNHAGIRLPDLHQGLLDAATLHQLFHDIFHCATVLEVIPKYARRGFIDGSTIPLSEAERLLIACEVRAVQVRYRFQDAEWWDTLIPTPQGTRIVRIRHDFNAPAASS